MDTNVINIRIEVDLETDRHLEEWSSKERRSKKEHVAYMVQQVIDCYQRDPFILQRLSMNAGGNRMPLTA